MSRVKTDSRMSEGVLDNQIRIYVDGLEIESFLTARSLKEFFSSTKNPSHKHLLWKRRRNMNHVA